MLELQAEAYRSGHITYSSFKNALFEKVDFICVNMKNSKFKGAVAVRDYGDQYQALVFWKYALDLLKKDSDMYEYNIRF